MNEEQIKLYKDIRRYCINKLEDMGLIVLMNFYSFEDLTLVVYNFKLNKYFRVLIRPSNSLRENSAFFKFNWDSNIDYNICICKKKKDEYLSWIISKRKELNIEIDLKNDKTNSRENWEIFLK